MSMPDVSPPWWWTEFRRHAGIAERPARRTLPVVVTSSAPCEAFHADDRKGMAWTEAEVDRLRQHYHERRTLEQMATLHRRSHGAITSRLCKMGLVEFNRAVEAYFRHDGLRLE